MTHNQLVAAIRAEMDRQGMTAYRLHINLKDQVCKQTIYNFVQHGEVIHTDSLVAIMDALSMTLVPSNARLDSQIPQGPLSHDLKAKA
jgi:hypothetical protein